jgi:hypothetical protein
MKKLGRPIKQDKKSARIAARLRPHEKEFIIQVFGSVQKWIDQCLVILNETKNKK